MLKRLLRHRVVQNALVMYGVQITGYVFPLITLPYLARVLGPDRFGLLTLGTGLTMYFGKLAVYGFDITGTRAVAIVSEKRDVVSRIYSTILACRLTLVAASVPVLFAVVFGVPKFRANYPLYLISFMAAVGVGLSPGFLFQGLQSMRLMAYSDYGAKIVSLGLIFLLVRSSSDYLAAASIQSGGFIVSACIGIAFSFTLVKVRWVWPKRAEMWQALVEGWPVFLSGAAVAVVYSSNTVLLGILAPPEEVGYYGAAVRLMGAAVAMTTPISTSFYPHMSVLAAKSREQALNFLRRRVLWLTIPFLLGSTMLCVLAPQIVHIIYGDRFAKTALLLRILAFSPFVQTIGICFTSCYMLPFGYEKKWSAIVRSSILFHMMALAVLCPSLGATVGVTVSHALTEVFNSARYVLFYYRTTREPAHCAVK